MADVLPCNEELPGLRDYSLAKPSYGGHGIDEILDVIHQLATAGIPSCVIGVRALRYYGAARITDVRTQTAPHGRLDASTPADCLTGMGLVYPR
jgi:hypothetical protein